MQRERRNYGSKSFCQHSFSCTWRTYHNYIMPACCSYFEGTFHIFLAFDVGKIKIVGGQVGKKFFPGVDCGSFQGVLPCKKPDHFFQVFNTVNFQIIDYSSFTGIFFGKDKSFESFFPGLNGNG